MGADVHEAHRSLVIRAAETHNARHREAFLACYSNPMQVISGEQTRSVTPEEHWAAVLRWAAIFGGFFEEIQEMVVEGDLVFLRSRYRGVHQGVWRGLAPTGKDVEWEAWQVLRIENDLIVEERMLMDQWALYEELSASESQAETT